MYGLPDAVKRLSAAEEQVLLAVWAARPPVTRAEIARHLPLAEKPWADATLLNFLYRLEEKGWVRSEKQGNKNVYTPAITKRAYGVYTMRERAQTVFGGSIADAIAALLSESSAGQAELLRIRNAVDEKLAGLEEYDWYDPYG